MKKRGAVETSIIVKAIIALALIAILIYVMPAQIKNPVMKLLGFAGNYSALESDLAVTETEFQITQLKTVSNSVNALVCGINSVSTGEYPHTSCAEPYDATTQDLKTRTANQENYAQVIGDALLNAFKIWEPLKKEYNHQMFYTINPEKEDIKIDLGKIQEYLRTKEESEANDLSGKGLNPFQVKNYDIKLTENTLKKGAMICGDKDNHVLLTDDLAKCKETEIAECEGEGAIQYGATCLKCDTGEIVCCEFPDRYSPGGIKEQWDTKENCVKFNSYKILQKEGDDKDWCGKPPIHISNSNVQIEKLRCTITNFNLPQETPADWKQWIGNFGDPEYLVYHESFPVGEEKSWQFEPDRLFMASIGIQSVFAIIPIVGKAVKAATIFSKSSRIVSAYSDALQQATKTGDKIPEGTVKKIMGQLDNLAKKSPDEAVRTLAELQKATIKHGPVGIAIREFDDVGAKQITTTITDFVKNPSSGINIASNGAFNIGSDNAQSLKKILLDAEYFDGLNIRGNPALEKAVNDVVDRQVRRGFTSIDDLSEKISKEISDNANTIIDDAIAAAVKRPAGYSTLGRMLQKAGYQKTFKAIYEANDKNLVKMMETSLDSMKKLKEISPDVFENSLKNADEVADILIDAKTGAISWDKMIADGTSADLIRQVDNIPSGQLGVQINSFKDLLDGKTIGKGLYAGTLSSVGADEGIKTFMKKQAWVIGCVAAPTAALATVGTGGVIGTGATVTASAACAKWIGTNQLPILLLIGHLINQYDSKNEKYKPVGNAIAVTKPRLLKDEFDARSFDVSPTKQAYISIYRDTADGQPPQKLFFASPCQTDLEIKMEYCSGDIYSGDYILEYELQDKKYYQPVKPLALKKFKQIYYWDTLSDEEKIRGLKSADVNQDTAGSSLVMGIFQKGLTTRGRIQDNIDSDPILLRDLILLLAPDMKSFVYHIINKANPISLSSMDDCIDYETGGYCLSSPINLLCQLNWPLPIDENIDSIIPSGCNPNLMTLEGEEYKDFVQYLVDYYNLARLSEESEELPEFEYILDREYGLNKISVTDQANIKKLKQNIEEFMSVFIEDLATSRDTIETYEDLIIKHEEPDICKKTDYYSKETCQILRTRYLTLSYKEEKNFLEYTGRRATYNFIYFTEDDAEDKSKIVKSFTQDYRYQAYDETIPDIEGVPRLVALLDTQSSNRLNIIKKHTTVPCITVTPNQVPYGYKDNYCYSGKSKTLENIGALLDIAGITGGIFLSGVTGGFTVPIILLAADAGSIATSIALKVCGNWPNHKCEI